MNEKEFLALIEEVCDADAGTVTLNDSMHNPSLFDSLAMLSLISVLDKKFGISIRLDGLKEIGSVGDLFKKIT